MRIIRYSLLFLIVFLVVTASGQTLRIPPNTTETSTVTVTQPSNGVISGWGISCGTSATDCAESFLNFTTVTLTATPDSGAVFNGWAGACADRGTNTTCTLTLSAGVAVAASFTLTTRNLTITKAGTGAGHVYDADFNVICSDSCTSYSHDYPLNTSVTIHAWATAPDTWDGYSGNCSGTGENPPLHDCTLTMSSNKAVTTTFTTGASFNMYAKPSSQGAVSSGTCSTPATACTVAYALSIITAGQTLGLMGTNSATDGLYQGVDDMIAPPSGKSGTSTNRITVAAVSDGGVFIDGQFARPAVYLQGNNYMTLEGFDAGNGGGGKGTMFTSDTQTHTGLIFRRICASNAQQLVTPGENTHVFNPNNVIDGLFEDICVFGVGRNMLIVGDAHNSVFRRIWARHEGYSGSQNEAGQPSPCDDGPAYQIGYHDLEPYNDTYEDLISIHSFERITSANRCYSPNSPIGFGSDQLTTGKRGYITKGHFAYAYDNAPYALNGPGFFANHFECPSKETGPYNYADIFIDVHNQLIPPLKIVNVTNNCANADRLTGYRVVGDFPSWNAEGNASNFLGITPTNSTTDCTSLAACPNFYTGVGPGGIQGSRACFEYLNGTLTQTPLWPWKMDDRIKAALARARGTVGGGTALSGTSGTGYAANTVTSEIVARYGAIPAACLR